MRVKLEYRFGLWFDAPVSNHHFALRITPKATDYYRIISLETSCHFLQLKDSFENLISFGEVKEAHDFFGVDTTATFEFHGLYGEKEEGLPCELYLFDTPLTHRSIAFRQFMHSAGIEYKGCEESLKEIAAFIFENFTYQRGATDVSSGIDTLIEYKKGVCQDFAHLMIAILREHGIPARYVSGFVQGEGESHAWVEYFDGTLWRGADPTHNLLITFEPYIKIAHGRDAADVSMNKGVFRGGATHRMEILATIKEYQ